MNPLNKIQSSLASLTVSLVLLVMTGIANATILAYEPFDYPVGALNGGTTSTAMGTPTATTGGGFKSPWFSGGVGTTIVAGLTYPGLETGNNALQWSTSVPYHGEDLATAILPSTTPSVYVSFLYNAPSYIANKSGFALDNGAASNQGYYMGMTASGVFGVATVANGSGTVLGTAAETISFNTTYFIVVKFVKNATGTYYQSGSIWINPAPGGSEPAASGTFTGTYTVMNKFQDFLTALGGSAVITDEIRLGTTWADVTPANGLAAPAAPTALQVDSSGDNTVSLSWTASAAGTPASYNVKRATSFGGTYSTVGSTTAPTVSFTDLVTGGTTYYYAVSAVSIGGESADSSPPVSATPTLGVPDAPIGLASTSGDSQVALNWSAPAIGNPTSYNVKRSTASGGPFTNIIGTTTAPTTSYNDPTAVNGTTYYYVVSAVNTTGEGADSSEVIATPAVFTGIYEPFNYPVEDNLLSGTASTADGFGTWDNGVAGWITSGLTYPNLPTANNAMRTPSGRQSVSIDAPLSSDTKWISYLWSHSPGDPGGNNNGVYFPNGGTGLYFGWGLGAFDGTQGYMALGSINTTGTAVQGASLLKKTAAKYTYGGTYLIVLEIIFNTSGNFDTVAVYVNPTANQPGPGVPAAAVYTSFDVGTISGIGMQVAGGGDFITDEWRIADSYIDVVDAVVIPPNAPTGLSATPGPNSISLSWTAATGGAPTGYNVKRATSSDGTYEIIGTTTAPTTSYTDLILGGTTYYYVVSAFNLVDPSPDSSFVVASAILAPPSAPGGLSALEGDSQVSLSWSASTFASSYDVKRAYDIGGPYVSIGITTDLTYIDLTVLNSQTYYYVVAAINAAGPSPDTSPVSASPFGPLPLVLSIEPGVGITWFAGINTIYQVQWASEDLGIDTVWNDLDSPIIGDDSTITVFDPSAAPENVYQVISY